MSKAGTCNDSGRQDGFTLIELLVALLLVGFLVGILFPRLPDLLGVRLKASARFLSGTVAYLYDRSVTERAVLRLNLDLEKREYWVSQLGKDNQFEEVQFPFAKRGTFPDPVRLTRVDTQTGGAVETGVAVIHFFPNGFIEPATLHLSDGNRNEMKSESASQ